MSEIYLLHMQQSSKTKKFTFHITQISWGWYSLMTGILLAVFHGVNGSNSLSYLFLARLCDLHDRLDLDLIVGLFNFCGAILLHPCQFVLHQSIRFDSITATIPADRFVTPLAYTSATPTPSAVTSISWAPMFSLPIGTLPYWSF